MTNLLDHLKAALADRYAIERELGAGGMATVYGPPGPCRHADALHLDARPTT
jgi:hypothetical protein